MNAESEHLYRDLVWVAGNLRASQIYVSLRTSDQGIGVWIADRLFRIRVDHSVSVPLQEQHLASFSEVALWLHDQALSLFPDSDYARRHIERGVETRFPHGSPPHAAGTTAYPVLDAGSEGETRAQKA